MFSLVRVFVKITLRGSLKVLLCVLGGLEILMKNFEKRSAEYQKCLVARDDKPGKVKKQFSDIKKLTREEARKPKLQKTTFSASFNFITQYKTLLPHLKTMISNHLPILYSNQQTSKANVL